MKGTRRRLPPLGAVRAFEAAARHLSFTHAAEELYVTHGAISHQVRDLERYLGCALFRRLHRRIVLTEAGEALFAKVRLAFDLLEVTAAQVAAAHTRRPLVVSCIATFSMRWLMPRLHQFTARHPDIDIRLCAPDSPVEFPRDDVDLSIRAGPPDESEGMEQRAFLEEEFGPVCSPTLAQRCPLTRPEDLHRHTLLHTDTRRHAWHEWLHVTGVAGIDPTAGQHFETFYFLLQAAVSGFGVAIGPHPLVADDIATGRLVAPFGFAPHGLSMYVSYAKARATDPQLIAFRDWLIEAGSTPQPSDPSG